MNNADIFKALGEQSRFRIMRLLLKSGKEACGCELVDSLLIPQYNLTKHLDILIHAGLIKSRKEGRWAYYGLSQYSPFYESVCEAIQKAKDRIYEEDLIRFKKRLSIREGSKCLWGIQNKELSK